MTQKVRLRSRLAVITENISNAEEQGAMIYSESYGFPRVRQELRQALIGLSRVDIRIRLAQLALEGGKD